MAGAILSRLAVAVPTVLLVLTLTFVGLHAAPGDPVTLYLGPGADPLAAEAMRQSLGLDRPLPLQYADWLARFVSLDWGISIAQRRPVLELLADAAGPTLLLTGLSLLLSYLVGLALAAAQVARRRTWVDTTLTALTTTAHALPAYVLALGLVLLFAYGAALWAWPDWLRFPALGAAGLGADFLSGPARFADQLRHLVLPVATLALIGAGGAARFCRAAMVDVLRQPFVRAARAKGLSERAVLARHALQSALPPIVTLLGLQLPALFSGVVFVETIFAWPGMGRVTVQAVLSRDYPVVMASTAVFAALVVAGNLLADVMAAAVDPRLRRQR
jgi:peptide/nickel transport system permease protein